MPSKKERIEYLETQVAGLHDKLSETIQELEELKKRVGNAWLIPTSDPVTAPAISPYSGISKCWSCGQSYFPGVGHVCPGTLYPYKITCTTTTNTKKEGE